MMNNIPIPKDKPGTNYDNNLGNNKEPFDWKGMFTQTGDLLASLGTNNNPPAGNAPAIGANTHYSDSLGPLVSKYIDNTDNLKNLYGLLQYKS